MLRCQLLCHILKALFFIKIALKLSYFCKKNAKFSSARSSAPRPPKQLSPLRISGYAPGNKYCIIVITLGRRQRRDLSVFESRCHLPTCLPHTAEASHCPFDCLTSSRKAVNTNFYSLWLNPTGNRTRIYRFSSRRSIHSTTDRFKMSR